MKERDTLAAMAVENYRKALEISDIYLLKKEWDEVWFEMLNLLDDNCK